MTYHQSESEKKTKKKKQNVNGKNVTLHNFNPEFWITFLTDEIKVVTQEQKIFSKYDQTHIIVMNF